MQVIWCLTKGVVLKVNQPILIDIIIALIFIALSVAFITVSRNEQNIGIVDLTESKLTCRINKKHDNYTGYYHLNNQKYFSSHNYRSCGQFIEEMVSVRRSQVDALI